jgi:hypothetical protein
MKNSLPLTSTYVELPLASKMVRYCRLNFGPRGERWDFEGSNYVQFHFKEEKDRTWFYFIFAHDMKDPHER